jgi:DNA-binding CsgD family transcriptional regulator
LEANLADLREWLNLRELVLATSTLSLSGTEFLGAGQDAAWVELYLREEFARVDPIINAIRDGNRFFARERVIAAATRANHATVQGLHWRRFLEATQDFGRHQEGYAGGIVINGRAVVMSALTNATSDAHRSSLVLGALRPLLSQALLRVSLPAPPPLSLSTRERALLECLASGQSDSQIANSLGITPSTVRFHLGNVFRKLGARNRCHAVAQAHQFGLLPS